MDEELAGLIPGKFKDCVFTGDGAWSDSIA